MPEVKDKMTGKTVAKMPYDTAGQMAAEKMVAENPGYEIKDGSMRSEQMYAGGGKAGYNKIGMYKDGGKVNMYKDGGLTSSQKKRLKKQAKRLKLNENDKKDFCITHFFNPVRYMGLLEIVREENNDKNKIELLKKNIMLKRRSYHELGKDTKRFEK